MPARTDGLWRSRGTTPSRAASPARAMSITALRTSTCADTFPPSTGVAAGPDTDTAKSSGGSAPIGMDRLASLLLVLSSPALTSEAFTETVSPE